MDRVGVALLAAALLVGCTESEGTATAPSGPTGGQGGSGGAGGCDPGQLERDGECVDAGLPTNGCPPGHALIPGEDTCLPAGVPADMCGTGFESDGDHGCRAILPAAPCSAGMMAVPGETSCREVASCGDGTWGDIPTASDTQFVDGSYTGGSSDGTQTSPWTTVQEAVDTAAAGATIAVAAGSYAGAVTIEDKAVTLWGRCPGLVELVGTGGHVLRVGDGATGSAVRDLALTGQVSWAAVAVNGASDVVFERVWLHDTGGERGFDITEATAGLTSAFIRDSLIERVTNTAIMVWGAEATVERTVVRELHPATSHGRARCFNLASNTNTGTPSTGVARSSVFADSRDSGVAVFGSTLELEDCLIVHSRASEGTGEDGRGVLLRHYLGVPAVATLRRSVIEDSEDHGIHVLGSDITLEAVTLRDTAAEAATGKHGYGLSVDDGGEPERRPTAVVDWTLIDRATHVSLVAFSADVSLVGVRLRNTHASPIEPSWGIGLYAGRGDLAQRPVIDVIGSVLEDHLGVAVLLWGADATMATTVIAGTRPATNASPFGMGVEANHDAIMGPTSLELTASLIDDHTTTSIALLGSQALIDQSVVRGTAPSLAGGLWGSGIGASRYQNAPSQLTLRSSLVEDHHLAGLGVEGSSATVEGSVVQAIDVRQSDGLLGDAVILVAHDEPAQLTLIQSRLAGTARAGLSSFGSIARVGSSLLSCTPVPLHGEPYIGFESSFEDQGHNVCACDGETSPCKVLSTNLVPPDGLGPPVDAQPEPDEEP